MKTPTHDSRSHVLIVGGGFAGLAAARTLDARRFRITLLDRENYHLFQPLLYQVATGSLDSTDIATPLRMIVPPSQARVVQAELTGIDLERKVVRSARGVEYGWDKLILAVGLGHNYFGHDDWRAYAPSLKFLRDAFTIRDRILGALETAEYTDDPDTRARHMRFAVIGGGPTGVELAGAIGELTGRTLAREFYSFDPGDCEIVLLEAGPRVLAQYSEAAAADAVRKLARKGVTVRAGTRVLAIDAGGITLEQDGTQSRLDIATVIWAAGAAAPPRFRQLAEAAGFELDRAGRIAVDAEFRVPGHPDVFAVGDVGAYTWDGQPLPGLAPAAEQAGTFVARYLNGTATSFRYTEQGQLAVIGRNAAVGNVFGRPVRGRVAWWGWLLVHIRGLIGFDVKIKVMIIWAWKFAFDKYGARVIRGRTDPSD
ncbi:MAG: NAD(P)/FAD-dependent oxidoreductase [Pseudomonadales bacterium]|jgi:NADH dehydrogenase